jgi:hypothetical protein
MTEAGDQKTDSQNGIIKNRADVCPLLTDPTPDNRNLKSIAERQQ